MTPCICCVAIFNIHILLYFAVAVVYAMMKSKQAKGCVVGWVASSFCFRVPFWVTGGILAIIIFLQYLLSIMMALYHALLFTIFCLVLSPISFCKAFSNPNTQNRQSSSLQLKTNKIIERDVDVSTSRRSFFISTAATLASSSGLLFIPLKANAVTDCFKDCVKNCKLIAPKVRLMIL